MGYQSVDGSAYSPPAFDGLQLTSRELKGLFVAIPRCANGPSRGAIRNVVSPETEDPGRKHAGWQNLQPVFR
jgi:hypothetical protein